VARVLIGAGTSCGYPTAMLIIRRRSHRAGLGEPPGSVLGSLAIAGSATVAIGPPIGGLLVGGLGWRTAFLLNIPLTAAALAMALAWIPAMSRRPPDGRSQRSQPGSTWVASRSSAGCWPPCWCS
jgi:MFS family permease